MTRAGIIGTCLGLTLAIVAAGHHGKSGSSSDTTMQKLTVREEPDRVVLAWTGPIETAMRDELIAAVNAFKADPRRMVLTMNSPGGSVMRGREVMAAIRQAAQLRPFDTFIDKGAVCASMCVPIFLLGANRMADVDAHFMFHEVSLDRTALKAKRGGAPALDPGLLKLFETAATNQLFDADLRVRGVNSNWLTMVRSRIAGHEIWISGRQLVAEGSGVIDTLVDTVPR